MSKREAYATPRGRNTIDLTLSSDEEDSPIPKHSKTKPPVLNSDSDSDDSELDIVSSKGARVVLQESDSDDEEEEEVRVMSPNAAKLNKPRAAVKDCGDTDSGEDLDSSASEEKEDELEEDKTSNDSFVVPDDDIESRLKPKPASMADALAAMSFKKKPSPPPVAQKDDIDLDSDQENALRKHGFLPISKPKPQKTDPRAFYTSLTSKPNPTFLQPKLAGPFANRMSNQLPASSFSSSSDFSSNADAFNLKAQPISIKAKLGAQIQQENALKGIPIDVPKNPPSLSFRREETPKASKGIDVEAELENFGQMEIQNDDKEDKAVATFRQGLGKSNIEVDVDEDELDEITPSHLACTLLPHQVASLVWLKGRESGQHKNHGGLLADDMGLGKTVQMISLILANPSDRTTIRSKTTLIVCPVGLLRQWKVEVEEKTKKHLRVLVHHGPKRKNEARELHKYDIVVTNYETVLSDHKKGGALFDSTRPFYRVILDEAHTIKNPSAQKSLACTDLKAEYRWALTGTPIQNSVNDLFSIFRFLGKRVVPSDLWEKPAFDEQIGRPIKSKQNKIAFERLSAVLGVLMLRRTKSTTVNGKPILPLPKRIVNIVGGPFLDSEEEAFYKAIEEKMVLSYNAFLRGTTSGAGNEYAQVLVRLLRMRQATNHPALVTKASIESDQEALDPGAAVPGNNDEPKASTTKTAGDSSTPSCLICREPIRAGQHCESCAAEVANYSHLQSSTKIKRTMQLLEKIRKEPKKVDENGKSIPKKTIIFSQFTSMFDLLEKFLVAGGFGFVRFDGKCKLAEKDAAIDKITNKPKITVILISIKSGAVGLNLTMCSRVILLDLWYNPQIENQAFDRAHRFGQKEDVEIYKLVIDGTVEDRILTLQQQKSELASNALEGGDASKAKLTKQDMAFLFKGDNKGRKKKAT
ncbi:hypothetical protein JCM5353_008196 [Sporobolomyces roseus]